MLKISSIPQCLFLALIGWACFPPTAAQVEFKHHNNTELAEVLQHIHNKCPDTTRLYTLSEPSVNGIPLYVLEITDNPGKHELRELFLFRFVVVTIRTLRFLSIS